MDYYNYDYRDHDRWRNENQGQYHYDNNSYDNGCYYDECYVDNSYETYDNGYYEPCENDWRCNGNSYQSQYQESPSFSENSERSEFDQMLETAWKFKEQQERAEQMREMEENSKRILAMEKYLEEIVEHLKQHPFVNHSDTTEVSEVSSLSSDEFIDNKVHEPTPPEVEMVVEDCVSLDDKDSEVILEIEEVTNDFENCNENLHDLETSKVGEGFVEVNATPNPTDLKANEHEKEPLVFMESKELIVFKQPHVVIDRPLRPTIYTQNSCWDCTIDEIFGNKKERLLLFEITNVPPMSGDLVVINTIDDKVHEHNTNMLTDTSNTLESCLSCFRSKEVECRIMKRRLWRRKHDASHGHKVKMKVFHDTKSRMKKSTRRKDVWFDKQRSKRLYGRMEGKRLGVCKENESMTFGPGGSHVTYDPG